MKKLILFTALLLNIGVCLAQNNPTTPNNNNSTSVANTPVWIESNKVPAIVSGAFGNNSGYTYLNWYKR